MQLYVKTLTLDQNATNVANLVIGRARVLTVEVAPLDHLRNLEMASQAQRGEQKGRVAGVSSFSVPHRNESVD